MTTLYQSWFSGSHATNSHPSASHLLWAETLKTVAMVAVITIHCAAPALAASPALSPESWWRANLYESLSRWCIPVFFMLSGALLLERKSTTHPVPFLVHRLSRIGLPFLFWSLLYFTWRKYINGEPLSYWGFFRALIDKPLFYHLWFLYALLGLYLFAPLLSSWLKNASRSQIVLAVALWALFGSLAPFSAKGWGIPIALMPTAAVSFFSYAGFFVVGTLLLRLKVRLVHLVLLLPLFGAACAVTAWGCRYRTIVHNHGRLDELFYDYFAPNVAVMALSLFLIFRTVANHLSNKGCAPPIRFISTCVPGIYLLHPLIISAGQRGMLNKAIPPLQYPASMGIPVKVLWVFGISLLSIAILRMIPGLRRIVP